VGVALVTLPDGKKARITFDSQDQLDATIDDLVVQHGPKTLVGKLSDNPVTQAVGETGLQMASGMAGAAAGGVAGVVRGIGAGAASLAQGEGLDKARTAFTDEATDTIAATEKAMQYEPKTKAGKVASEASEAAFTWLGSLPARAVAGSRGIYDVASRQGIDKAARDIRSTEAALKPDAAGETVSRVTGSPALGALTNVAIQSAPAALTAGVARGASMLRGAAAAREAAAAAAKPRVEPTLDPQQPGAAPQATPAPQPTSTQPSPQPQPQLTATGAPRQPPSTVGAGPLPAPGVTPQEAKAAAYARTLGLDWARLGAGTRKALTTIAQDATALERLSPAAVKRQALLESQRIPIPATRGQLERDPVQLRREAIASRTDDGKPIRDVDVAANAAVQANLEALRGRAAGLKGGTHDPVTEEGKPAAQPSIRAPTKLPTQVGESAQKAVREKAKWSEKGYEALYKRARETEPDARVSTKPLAELLQGNPDIQHLGFLKGWLAKAGNTIEGSENVSLKSLYDLRKEATGLARARGTDGYHAGQVVRAINEAMKQVPAGAKAWKAAIDAFAKHQKEFKDQVPVRKLATDKKGTGNRSVALENTWSQLARGPLENLRQVKRTMLTGGTPKIREMGRRAWRDLRGETVNQILAEARNNAIRDEADREIVTARALQRGINSIPRENLEELIGKANVRELRSIIEAAHARIPPGARTTESGTVPNALIWAEKVLSHIPGGKVVVGGAKMVKKLHEEGKTGETVRRAVTTPLDEAAQQAGNAAKSKQQYKDLESGPSLP
jgi:hypothetical protein